MTNDVLCVSFYNNSYLDGAKAFFKSLVKTNPKFNLPFVLFHWDDVDITELKKIYCNIELKSIDKESYIDILPYNSERKWNYNYFYRFEIFKLKANKIIYLDLDMIVLDNIDYLLNLDADFAAVELDRGLMLDHPGKFTGDKNFNGGVMLIGSKYLNNNVFNELKKLVSVRNWTGNEPLLNEYFAKHCLFIDKKYNTITLTKVTHNPYIMHFCGVRKPWHKGDITDRYDYLAFRNNGIQKVLQFQKLYNNYST